MPSGWSIDLPAPSTQQRKPPQSGLTLRPVRCALRCQPRHDTTLLSHSKLRSSIAPHLPRIGQLVCIFTTPSRSYECTPSRVTQSTVKRCEDIGKNKHFFKTIEAINWENKNGNPAMWHQRVRMQGEKLHSDHMPRTVRNPPTLSLAAKDAPCTAPHFLQHTSGASPLVYLTQCLLILTYKWTV